MFIFNIQFKINILIIKKAMENNIFLSYIIIFIKFGFLSTLKFKILIGELFLYKFTNSFNIIPLIL